MELGFPDLMVHWETWLPREYALMMTSAGRHLRTS